MLRRKPASLLKATDGSGGRNGELVDLDGLVGVADLSDELEPAFGPCLRFREALLFECGRGARRKCVRAELDVAQAVRKRARLERFPLSRARSPERTCGQCPGPCPTLRLGKLK